MSQGNREDGTGRDAASAARSQDRDGSQASAALELAEAKFRAVVEQLPAIVWTSTLENQTTYVSPHIERILGTPVDAWTSGPRAWTRHIHPDDRDRVRATMAESQRLGTTFRCEYRLLRKDGGIVWILDEAVLVRDAEGRAVAVQGVALDVTERKKAEAEAAARACERQALHRISEIGLSGRPLDQACRLITEEIATATGFPTVAIVLHDGGLDRLASTATRGPAAGVDRVCGVGFDEALCGVVAQTGRPLVWTDPDPVPAGVHEDLAARGIRTFIGVPMTAAGRVIGVLSMADGVPRALDPRLVEFTESLAAHVTSLTERARTQAALEASERHFHAVFDATLDAIVVLDETRTYVGANPAAARLFGVPLAQLVGRCFGDFAAPDTDLEAAWAAVRGERPSTTEWRLVRADGGVRDVESSFTTNFLPGRHLAVIRDITERKAADAERRVRSAALAAAANGILITDAEGRIGWVNPEFTRMTGYTLDEVRGQTPRVLASGHHDADFYGHLWTTIRAGRVWRGEMVNRRKDGTTYYEEQSITPVREFHDPASQITHFVAIKQDISERKRAEALVRRSEEYYRSLIDNALDLIIVIDADATVRYASPSVERILGYHPDEMVNTSTLHRLHPDDLPTIGGLLSAGGKRPGFTVSVEYRIRHKDGSWRTLEAIATNLLHHPAVAGIIVNARDVTERKRDEETQERLRVHLRQSEKLAAMGELLAGVAHELNNPLAVVIGHTALMARATDPAVAARAAKIGRAAERCGRIVKNFLALARQYPPERTPVNLNQLVADALEVLAYPLRVDNVEVATELAVDLPVLRADGHQLQQVMVNLVTNAHQAMRTVTGRRCLTIRSGSETPAGPVWFEVTDTGPGIPAEVQARLFEPFFTTKPLGQGTGLGLSICRGIVEGHGGHMSVDGGPGRGARFRVELPIGGPAPALPSAEGDEGRVLAPCRILVVDDETEVAGVVSELLRRDGHHADTAANGVDALQLLREHAYDAVISDIKMPHLDGIGLWTAVKETNPALAQRFAFFTGDTLTPATAEFIERTGAPSLQKPFALRDVRLVLAKVLGPAAPV
jgi:PAS domain S-box-containing protein